MGRSCTEMKYIRVFIDVLISLEELRLYWMPGSSNGIQQTRKEIVCYSENKRVCGLHRLNT